MRTLERRLPTRWRGLTILVSLAFCASFFTSCGGAGGGMGQVDYDPGYGPFDENGNYIQSEADKPARRKRPARSKSSSAVAEKSPPKPSKKRSRRTDSSSNDSAPVLVASVDQQRAAALKSARSQPAPPPPKPSPSYSAKPKPKQKTKPKPSSSSASVQSKPKSPPKPKAKPKPVQRTPKSQFHTVRKGDTLYGIARKYRSTVKAIQQANGIRGTVIRIGQTLKVPKR